MVLFYPIARHLLDDRPYVMEAAFVSLREVAPSYRAERESAVAWIVQHLTSLATDVAGIRPRQTSRDDGLLRG